METLELFYPQIAARAGPYTFDKGIEIEVYSSKSSYFDWAKIRFTEQFQPKISLARKDPAAIELGYNNVFEEVFTGYVSKPYNGGGFTDEVTLKDEMLLLEETQINNTFLDTTPQEMIAYFLGKAGLSKMKLSSKGYPERKRLPIRQMNVIEAINAVHAAWNIKQPFFFSGGVFYWGEKPEQDKTYIFEYGVNIIALTRSGGSWELETVSAPFVRHSHKISVKHPKVSGEFEVSKVVKRERLHPHEDLFLRKEGREMLEQMMRAVARKIIAQEYPHAKSPAVVYATVSKATQLGETFDLEDLVIHNDETGSSFKGHITAHWNEYTLTVVDRWGNEDESFPPLPGVRSKGQYKAGAFVAVAMAYGDSPAIIGEVQL